MPTLGIIASSTRQGQSTDSGAYYALQTITVGPAGASSITFSNIPSTYKHLQVRMMCINASPQSVIMQFNGDTASNYTKHSMYGTGSSAGGNGYLNQSYFNVQGYVTAGSTPNPVIGIVDILDYANTNKYKTARIFSGFDANGSGEVNLNSGLWRSTSAISSVTVKLEGGANFNQYSSFTLYGVKSA